jgi:3-hydroxyacyl-[acyl-carrier-protein] dehydratase
MESALELAADHPAYAGHFPGRPILPGVVILAEVLEAVAAESGSAAHRWTIASAKFRHPVVPGIALTLLHERASGGHVRFDVLAGTSVVASGTLVPRA